jgi:RNA polymerase sigma-70 factor (ECF subfamily)
MEDQVLLEQYKNGDVQALEQLVQRYRRPLYSYILNMTEGREDADEIFQETWLRAIKNLDRFTCTSVLSWLMRITRNLVIDRARKKKPDLVLDQAVGDDEATTMVDLISGDQPEPGQQIGSREAENEILALIDQLPDEQKEVFLMRVKMELSFKEIAEIQDVSINTALARMQYALTKLRPMVSEQLKGETS